MWPDVVVTLGAVAFGTLVFQALFRNIDPAVVGHDYKPCAGGWQESYLAGCEHGLTDIPQQPVNTYTNLAYLAVGLFVHFTLVNGASFVFAFTMLYLCVGSTLYHALSTRWAGMLDVTAIYAVYGAMAVYALAVLLGAGSDFLTPLYMFVAAGLLAYLLSERYHRHMRFVIGAALGATYLLVTTRMALIGDWGGMAWVIVSLVLFALGFGSWEIDKRQPSPLGRWGHGIWHVLTAAASGAIFYAINLVAEAGA